MYDPHLDVFLQVAELGSFSRAAEALFISAPAVIKQISLLENRIGVGLLHSPEPSPATARLWTHFGQFINRDVRTGRLSIASDGPCFEHFAKPKGSNLANYVEFLNSPF